MKIHMYTYATDSRESMLRPHCVTNSVIDPLPIIVNVLYMHVGTLPGGDDAPWVDKHKPTTAVSLLAAQLVQRLPTLVFL